MNSVVRAIARVVARKAELRRQWGQLRTESEVASYQRREIRRELDRRREENGDD